MTDLLVTTNDKFNSRYSGLTVTLVYFQTVEIAKAQQIILLSFFQKEWPIQSHSGCAAVAR